MKKDKLDIIFDLQKSFDDEIIQKRGLDNISPEVWLQKETLAMISELAELLDEVNFKWWKNPHQLNYDNIKNELIDILHFLTSMCIKVDMGSEEMYQRYIEKNKENFMRQYGRSNKEGYNLDALTENMGKEGQNGGEK